MHFHFRLILFVLAVSLTLSSAVTAAVNSRANDRIAVLEMHLKTVEKNNGVLSADLWKERLDRQKEVQRVDESQARGFNGVTQMIRLAEDPREDKARYFQSQSLFLAAKVEYDAGRISNAQSLALTGMAMATNSSIIGCRNAQSTIVRVTESDAVPILVKLLEGSLYQVEALPQVQPSLTEVRVTPVKFLPGC